ncbi:MULTISPECIES: DUF1152 domain-containing protein [unclassified Streptomyces]|uniref:DUF1152 domain-containing protein n=1 Tax=unclassified Streptomyces TaxID=2593676 RepID=UPI002252D3B8|nr:MULTISPECIES: DUF1152 domain-containing protein [unclassified Streptomyces]MCX5144863.1 DUF1152 domain-containing protein [Streptomyces sp. NBC_00338]WRZ62879.1 DUF1152 domain-containing protein [Streptomyces sp. NBC_01257]WSU56846.1 DUF1152 domain-containing protein [Streptomyces sp. NBC_01104]
MTQLLIAAGGGGDVIGTTLVHRALHGDEPAVVLSYAWERLVVDPLPGPRSARDFTGLRPLTPSVSRITADSAALAPGGSTLPRLAAELPVTLGLLDPYGGVTQLARQIAETAERYDVDEVEVVDVGGDVFARGDEPTLLSPLPDALVIAACATAGVRATLHLAGPGLDCEIPEHDLLPGLGTDYFTLTEDDTTCVEHVFAWHPSEASALLVAAARGRRGGCVVRDTGRPVVLTDASPRVYRRSIQQVLDRNRLAGALCSRAVDTLDEAERVSRDVCGFSELQRERDLSSRPDALGSPDGSVTEAMRRLDPWLARLRTDDAQARYVTFRCVAEGLGLTGDAARALRARLISQRPQQYAAPLFAL